MGDFEYLVRQWGTVFAWAVGGGLLLVRYRRHPQTARRGLLAAAVWLGLALPLRLDPGAATDAVRAVLDVGGATAFRVYQWAYVGCESAALLLARAAVADRPRPAADVD